MGIFWLSHIFSAFTVVSVAKIFMDNVYNLHGMPQSIFFDRDKVFTSWFWQKVFTMLGTKLQLSSTYHPQRLKRMGNQSLEMYLRCLTFQQPKLWGKWLTLAEWWNDATYHSPVRMTPFEKEEEMNSSN